MKRTRVVFLCATVASIGLAQTHGFAQRSSPAPASTQKPRPATPRKAPAPAQPSPVSSHSTQDHTAVVRKYCATCHSEKGKAGGLSLDEWFARSHHDASGLLAWLAQSPHVVPGQPESSRLISALASPRGSMAGVLAPREIDVIRDWIRQLPDGVVAPENAMRATSTGIPKA